MGCKVPPIGWNSEQPTAGSEGDKPTCGRLLSPYTFTTRTVAARGSSAIAALTGVLYATGIWLVSYQGWVPALGIMPPASGDRRGRVVTMLAAHWVYGAALGTLARLLRR